MNMFPKILILVGYLLIGIVAITLVVDVGNSFLVESRHSFVARNANVYVSKFAIDEQDLLGFGNKTITEDKVKDTLAEFFKEQYEPLGYTLKGSPEKGSGRLKMVFEPHHNFKQGADYVAYGPITIRAKFSNFNSGGTAKVHFNIEQKMPFTIRNFLFNQYGSTSEGAGLRDSDGSYGYFKVNAERAFSIDVIKGAL